MSAYIKIKLKSSSQKIAKLFIEVDQWGKMGQSRWGKFGQSIKMSLSDYFRERSRNLASYV